MREDAETRDRRQRPRPGFKAHLGSRLPKRLMVEHAVEITHPVLGSAKLNHMEMPETLTAEFLVRVVLPHVRATGMQCAHQDGMKSDMSGRERGTRSRSARGEMLDCVAAGKRSQHVHFVQMGLLMLCVFSLLQTTG